LRVIGCRCLVAKMLNQRVPRALVKFMPGHGIILRQVRNGARDELVIVG
jgi:hypothetical protein